jgi:hypothetical protein
MPRSVPLLFALSLLASSATAQQIRGVVVDATSGRPVERAVLVVLDADSAVRASAFSALDGSFVLNAPPGRNVRVQVRRLGFEPHRSAPLLLARNESLEWRIELQAQPLALEGVTATAPAHQNLERFMRNQETAFGRYIGPDEISRINPRSTSNLLMSMSGSPFRMSGATGKVVARGRGGGSAGTTPGTCVPHVYIDGFVLEEEANPMPWAPSSGRGPSPMRERGIALEAAAPARSVRGVEVYPNPSNAPPEFQRTFMPDCVVVAIWTDFGFGYGRSRREESPR